MFFFLNHSFLSSIVHIDQQSPAAMRFYEAKKQFHEEYAGTLPFRVLLAAHFPPPGDPAAKPGRLRSERISHWGERRSDVWSNVGVVWTYHRIPPQNFMDCGLKHIETSEFDAWHDKYDNFRVPHLVSLFERAMPGWVAMQLSHPWIKLSRVEKNLC